MADERGNEVAKQRSLFDWRRMTDALNCTKPLKSTTANRVENSMGSQPKNNYKLKALPYVVRSLILETGSWLLGNLLIRKRSTLWAVC